MRRTPILAITALALLVLAAPALATDGYFTLGYGTQYNGMAGAGQALHLSTLASATNPATIAFVKGYDVERGPLHAEPRVHRLREPVRLPRHVRPRARHVREPLEGLRHARPRRRVASVRQVPRSGSRSTATAG